MMIISLQYVVYKAPTELCKVLWGCLVEFYTHLVCFCLFGRSLEAVDCSADPGKISSRSKFFGSVDFLLSSYFLYLGSQEKWDLYLM